ncbi:hypothetical protein ACFPOA_08510 [Lysobacter niabensis]
MSLWLATQPPHVLLLIGALCGLVTFWAAVQAWNLADFIADAMEARRDGR